MCSASWGTQGALDQLRTEWERFAAGGSLAR